MLKQSLQQKLQQKLSPQQIQLMKMIQLPAIALEQRIKEEMEVNPVLEEGEGEEDEEIKEEYEDEMDGEEVSEAQQEFDYSEYDDDEIPAYKMQVNNRGKDEEVFEIPISSSATFHEMLETQLGFRILGKDQMTIAKHLIGNLDDAGYLRRDLASIVDDIAFSSNITTSEAELENLLKIIQELDPPGVGARTLQECLLLQLERKEQEAIEISLAKFILKYFFVEFTRKLYDKIQKDLQIDEEELRAALDEILKLNPKPGNSMSPESFGASVSEGGVVQIVPDFVITTDGKDLELTLNSRNMPELKVSKRYSELLEEFEKNKKKQGKTDKEAMLFVRQKLESAQWFIEMLRQRSNTLKNTMEAIMNHQKEYFLEGDETKLKPMILKDIADKTGYDISTVSRVSNSKYVQTPYGTFLLKSFFNESIATESGEEVSSREVKKILQDIIEGEDKKSPATDEEITKILNEKGYRLARRTVAKYREMLNIPVARLRKEL